MSLLHHIDKTNFSVLIWQIEESEEELKKGIVLHPSDSLKLSQLNYPDKRKEFLALRQCLRVYFGFNPEVFYQKEGKPYLNNNNNISFTHTRNYAAIIVSKKLNVGIDLESYREGIRRVAPKFMLDDGIQSLSKENEVEHLTQYWGAKEVVVKIEGNRRLDFKKDIIVPPFTYHDHHETEAKLVNNGNPKTYELHFSYFKPLTLTYGWLKA